MVNHHPSEMCGRVHRIEPEDSPSGGPQGKSVLEYVIFAGSVRALYLNCEELVSREACWGGINSSLCSLRKDLEESSHAFPAYISRIHLFLFWFVSVAITFDCYTIYTYSLYSSQLELESIIQFITHNSWTLFKKSLIGGSARRKNARN